MGVPIEFYSIIVPKKVLIEKYPGGVEQHKSNCPNTSYLDDEYLTRVGFMDYSAVANYCDNLIVKGLQWDDVNRRSDDFVVIQNPFGMSWRVEWVTINEENQAVYTPV
ncbi:MAG: hypothetical protein H6599_03785 [Flavobacteriales bacterium]|nr:hypothetical protein [Flavobacteriales bacterium]